MRAFHQQGFSYEATRKRGPERELLVKGASRPFADERRAPSVFMDHSGSGD